ncbi:hypothetical protein [Olivibacter ginsenosidimutans]|uniref:hypothetical protein n=1 Tax=Olivibacter ginsenosidimutans TaxID=1176537 RepID=UPI0031EC6337
MKEHKSSSSIVERLKARALAQQKDTVKVELAKTTVRTCPNCGAGRAKQDGLTHCAYCGYCFSAHTLVDGIQIKQSDNSK